MITKVKLSTSQTPLDANNDMNPPKGIKYPVGAGISLRNQTPVANTVDFDDTSNGQLAQGGNVFARLIKSAGAGISAFWQTMYPIKVQGTDCAIYSGAGSPEGVVTANPGSIYLNSSGGAGTSIFVKQSGISNTGWVGK